MSAIFKIKIKKFYILKPDNTAYTTASGDIVFFDTAKEAQEYIASNNILGTVKNNS